MNVVFIPGTLPAQDEEGQSNQIGRGFEEGQVGTDVISKILNHVESGVTAVYNRHSYDPEKRDALERWERHLLGIVSVSGQQTSDSGLAARAQEWRVPHEGDQQIER